MTSEEKDSGTKLSQLTGTDTSQASTKVAGSHSSATQYSDSTRGLSNRYDTGAHKVQHVGSEEHSTLYEPEKALGTVMVEVDGLKRSKPNPAWTETTNVPKEHLGFVQVVAFMINQSIGSGIFFSPGAVVLLTRSKAISIILWIVGGIYSMLSACVFLEFSTALPYNGGPLIYLDEVFPKPRMLAAVIFSWYWILLCAVDGACVTAATYMLQLVYPDEAYGDINTQLSQFAGIVVNSFACLLLYFVLRGCLLMNSLFAGFKVMLLVVFFVAGIVHACKSGSGLGDFTTRYEGANALDSIAAMTQVLRAYEGWETTNYIAGEIRAPKAVLKRAAFTALSIITILYVLVTVAYLAVLPYEVIEETSWDISVIFAREVFGGGKASKVAVMLSATSAVIAATYTAAKVKQAIAWQRIIPFSDFWGKQDRQFNSPGGALLLHWIFTTIHIATMNPGGNAWNFQGGLFIYGFEMMIVFLCIGIFLLPRRMKVIDPTWRPMYTKNIIARIVVVGVTFAVSILFLYSLADPGSPNDPPLYWWPIALCIIIGAATLYWGVLRLLQMRWFGATKHTTIGEWIGFEVSITERGDDVPDELVSMMREAQADGGNRRLTYKTSGWLAKLNASIKGAWKVIMTYLG